MGQGGVVRRCASGVFLGGGEISWGGGEISNKIKSRQQKSLTGLVAYQRHSFGGRGGVYLLTPHLIHEVHFIG